MFVLRTHRRRSTRLAGGLAATALALGLAGGAPALAQTAAVAAPAAAPKLSRAQVDALLATPDKVVFIDLRRPDEISALGTLPVYLNIPISELDRFLAYIPRDRQVVTVSNHAGRAAKGAAILADKGFAVAGVVGVENYAEEGGALYGRKVVTPAIAGVVKADTRVEVIREGFAGTEGPIALADGSVLFTEGRADRIVKLGADGSVSTYLEHIGVPNALALSARDELLAVQTAPAAIAVLQPAPKVLAAKFAGKPFGRPNDFALARSGDIYFSDPGAPQQPGAAPATPNPAFYWLDHKAKVHLVASDIARPNGVALSPDEKTLYLANTAGEYLIAFAVQPDGSLAGRHDFAKLAGFRQTANGPSSGADGIVVDKDGRVYVATSAGIEVFAPAGQPLGVITLPKQPQNLAFGGKDHAFLYAVGRGSAYRIATQTAGVNRPGK
ncbi:SMP-30/gluconolactonase/LRE family protein [Novosphingobium flavum]|uniref:SMP-30/gluconolactonase/LRE family protein n=1 Tax=Novosphingobium flavum TaxID=1778672 RepID=A0A7X1FR53_9SPHN|nr:SMP-30/gluconolactonase/LRE family protein [Novosphingobium flavum]MBC2665449.1 SMP-30/gluconolactonase/LRE family protein [Novosphingobium flavum]